MKLNAWFLILFLVFVPLSILAQEKSPAAVGKKPVRTLRFLSDLSSPPFAFREGIDNVGFEIDLGEALGKELGAKVEWIKQSFNVPTFTSTLVTNGADAVLSSMSITENRKQSFDFTRPYFRTSLAVATRKDVDWDRLAFKNGLENRKVGVMRRTTGEEWARKNLKATRKTYDSPTRLARALKNGDVYIILLDEDILKEELSSRSYKFKIVERDLDHEDYAIAVSKGNAQLLSELNSALEKLDESGVYDEIYNKWFGRKTDLP